MGVALKKTLNNKKAKVKAFFKSKKIIISMGLQPAELEKTFIANGTRWMRIAFTNRVVHQGTKPTTDIPVFNVIAIRSLPSKFKVWRFGLLKLKPKATLYKFRKGYLEYQETDRVKNLIK